MEATGEVEMKDVAERNGKAEKGEDARREKDEDVNMELDGVE